jgi:hypothetical protein
LRKFFAAARNAQFNEKLRREDQPNIKWPIFFSYFGMFNIGILFSYLAYRAPKSHRVVVAPTLLWLYVWFGYKWQIWWINHELLHQL